MASDSEPPMKRLRSSENQVSEAESVCAICFNDDGIGCRGQIDCCEHYFCFFCIMEWSKSESRCPVCRRQFSTIRRPGVFSGKRLISVTQKDQAREAINVDMYAETLCSICHEPENDYLTLICKLCESASHTYCVGLSTTVPEGDWFCPDCSIFRSEEEEEEEEVEEEEEEEEEDWPESYVLSRLTAERKPAKKKRESSGWVRMLRQSGNVRGRVRAVRDHLDSLRSEDLSFSATSSAEPPTVEIEKAASREEEASTSTSAPSNPAERQESRDAFVSYDVARAWKMFNMAKPPVRSRTGGIHIASEASRSRSFLPTVRQYSVNVAKQHKRSRGRDDDMKSEIQSLVKRNPKLLDEEQSMSQALGSRSCLPTVGSPRSVCRNVNEASSSANGVTSTSVGLHKERGNDSMKSEIQSLVKRNLKLLDKDKRLDVDSFKKIAQIATHTVMASCGLDRHKKYAILSFQRLACSHVELLPRQVSKSGPIPTCQKCLDSFVKNVAQSIMLEKDPIKRRSSE